MRRVSLLLVAPLLGCNLVLPLGGANDNPAADGMAAEQGVDLAAVDGPAGCPGLQPPPLLCEDFEAPRPPGLYQLEHAWGGDPPVRTADQARHGTYALLTRASAVGGYSVLRYDFQPPITGGAVNVRAWVNVAADAPPLSSWVVLFQITGELDDAPNWSKAGFDLGPPQTVHLHCPEKGWLSPGANQPLTQNTWYCVELRVSMAPPRTELWIDGKLVEACDPLPSRLPTGGYTRVAVGVSPDQDGARALIDDLVVSRGPVGCP